MRGERLGEFEEFTLLAICALGDAYGVPIQEFVERETRRPVAMGAIYSALDRLEAKGFVRSVFSEATAVRGGKRKRMFQATPAGVRRVKALRQIRERIWHTIEAAQRS